MPASFNAREGADQAVADMSITVTIVTIMGLAGAMQRKEKGLS